MTTHTTPIDLRPYHGREVEAATAYRTIKSKIMVDKDGDIYVRDSMGAVWIQAKNQEVFDGDYLKSITLLDEPNPINPEWDWKDGEEVYLRGNKYKCHMLKDDLVCFASAATGVCRKLFTLKAAYNHGFRKLPPQPQRKLVEITEEMFDKTNLINKRVEFINEDYTVSGMRLACGKRLLSIIGIQAEININECKLIEE